MRKFLILSMTVVLSASAPAFGRGKLQGIAQRGGESVIKSLTGLTVNSAKTYPGASVEIDLDGTSTKATLYSCADPTQTVTNPLTANSKAEWSACIDEGDYKLVITPAGDASAAWTLSGFRVTPTSTSISVKSTGAVGNGKTDDQGNAQIGNVTFVSATAGFTAADTGKTIVIYGAGNAAHTLNHFTTITFVNSTTVTLAVAPPATMNPATFVWGTNDTTNLNSAIASANSTITQFHPSNGPYVGAETSIDFGGGIFIITQPLVVSTNPYLNLTTAGNAVIVQADPTKDVIQVTGYKNRISGLTMVGGKRGIVIQNANLDSAKMVLDNLTIQGTNSYALYINSNVSLTATGIPYSTGTVSVTKGSNTVTGSGTVWVDANHAFKVLHLIASDEYYKIVEVTAGTTLVTSRAIKVTGAGLAYEIGDYHSSLLVSANNCHFINVAGVLYNDNEGTDIDHAWVELWGDSTFTAPYPMFQAHTAAFRTMYGQLTVNHMLGVPVMGIVGGGRIRNPRWFDTDGGHITVEQSRLGGEDAGMMIFKSFCPMDDRTVPSAYPYATGCRLILKDNWQVAAGQATDNVADVGILGLYANGRSATARENVPQMFVYKHNAFHAGTPIVNNEAMVDGANNVEDSASINTAAFFAAIPVSTERKFRWDLGPNNTGTDEINVDGTWNGGTRSADFQRFTGIFPTTGSLVLSNNLAAGSCDTVRNFGVAGASIDAGGAGNVGDVVMVGMPNNIAGIFPLSYRAWVSAANTVSIQICNPTTVAFVGGATGTVTIIVRKWKWFRD